MQNPPDWTFDVATDLSAWRPTLCALKTTPGLYLVAGGTGSGKLSTAAKLFEACRQSGATVSFLPEVRDTPSLANAISACQSGASVIATIHAGSTLAVKARLLQLGATAAQISAVVRGVLVQTLANRFNQNPADTRDWPKTLVSEYVLLHGKSTLESWDALLTLEQDFSNKVKRGLAGANAFDANMQPLKRAVVTCTVAELVATL